MLVALEAFPYVCCGKDFVEARREDNTRGDHSLKIFSTLLMLTLAQSILHTKQLRNEMKRIKVISHITVFFVSPNSVFLALQITVFLVFLNYGLLVLQNIVCFFLCHKIPFFSLQNYSFAYFANYRFSRFQNTVPLVLQI